MVGIVILNYNSWELTMECIDSIERTINEKYVIYVVDNLSTVPMGEKFKSILTRDNIKFIQSLENRGYSAGNNLGIKAALDDDCKYIIISNSDIIFHKNSIKNMTSYLKNNKEVGIVGPKVFLPSGEIQDIDMLVKTTLSIKYLHILKKTPLRFFIKNNIGFSHSKENLDCPFRVHAVSGCCFTMTDKCAKLLYPFDEVPFLYEEEIIIGVQMEKLKLQTIYLTTAEVTHYHGQTTKNLKAFSYIEFVRSEIYYLKKYLSKKNYEIFFLVCIRFFMYIKHIFKQVDYRENFKLFFSRGLEFFWKEAS